MVLIEDVGTEIPASSSSIVNRRNRLQPGTTYVERRPGTNVFVRKRQRPFGLTSAFRAMSLFPNKPHRNYVAKSFSPRFHHHSTSPQLHQVPSRLTSDVGHIPSTEPSLATHNRVPPPFIQGQRSTLWTPPKDDLEVISHSINGIAHGQARSGGRIHSCASCGRFRSASYQSRHPVAPGEIPKPSFCRKCLRDDTSSDGPSRSPKRARRKSRYGNRCNRRYSGSSRTTSTFYEDGRDDYVPIQQTRRHSRGAQVTMTHASDNDCHESDESQLSCRCCSNCRRCTPSLSSLHSNDSALNNNVLTIEGRDALPRRSSSHYNDYVSQRRQPTPPQRSAYYPRADSRHECKNGIFHHPCLRRRASAPPLVNNRLTSTDSWSHVAVDSLSRASRSSCSTRNPSSKVLWRRPIYEPYSKRASQDRGNISSAGLDQMRRYGIVRMTNPPRYIVYDDDVDLKEASLTPSHSISEVNFKRKRDFSKDPKFSKRRPSQRFPRLVDSYDLFEDEYALSKTLAVQGSMSG